MPTAKLPPISPTRQSKTLAGGASRTTARSPTAQLPAQPLPGIAATSTLPLETMVVQQYCMSLMSQGYVRSYSELFELTHDVSPVWLHREAATNSKVESSTNGDGEGTVAELDHPVAKCKRADDAADYADIPSLLSIMYTFVTLTTLHVKDTAKTVLPADRAERQRVLETIENATPRKSSYTVRTLSEIKALLMAAESASWSGDFTRIYQAETDLGVYYEKIHNARFASRHYRELYNAVPANEPKMIADAALRFAHSLVESGDYREALVTYERARDVVSKTAELAPEVSAVSKHVVETILQLGELEEKAKRYEIAKEHYMKALSVTQESCSEDLHLTGNVYRHLGEVHRALKSDAEAFAHMTKFLEVAEKSGDIGEQAIARSALAHCHEFFGQPAAAAKCLTTFVDQTQSLPVTGALRETYANIWKDLGTLYDRMDQHEDSLHAMDKAFQLAVELYEIDEKQARVHGHSSSSVPFSVNGGDGKADGASRTSPSPVVFLPMTADKNDSSVGNTGGHFPVPPSPLKSGAMTTGGLQVQPMTAGFQSIPSTAFNPSRIISALQFSANRTSSITDAESAPVTPAIASGKQRDYKLFTITQLQTGVARGKSKMAEYERWIAEGDTRTLLKWKTNRA